MLTPTSPSIVGICPAAMLIAEPVINAEIAHSGMKSTIQPARIKPMKRTIEPAIIASAEAITWPGMEGATSRAWRTMLPVTVDMTATG